MKRLIAGGFCIALLSLALNTAYAADTDIIINEFSSNGSSDWVELYNSGSESVNLEGWKIQDRTGTELDGTATTTISGVTLPAGGYGSVNITTQGLNIGGDIITLLNASSTEIDSAAYGSAASPDVAAPSTGEFAFRDSSGDWHLASFDTRDSANVEITIGTSYYQTIQEAVATSTSGDTINVAAGAYDETVNVDKAVTIKGAQAEVAGSDHAGGESIVGAFNITSGDVVIDGFSFNGTESQVSVSSATTLSGIIIKNSIFDGYHNVGLVTNNAGNILVQGNLFRDPLAGSEAMQIKANDNVGGCTGTSVLDNVFTNATDNGGSDVNLSCTDNDSTDITVSGNTSTGVSGGSSFTAFSGVTGGINIKDNTAATDGTPAFFFGNVSGSVLIDGNQFTSSLGSAVSIHGADFIPSDVANTGTFTITNNTLKGVHSVSVASSALGEGGGVIINNNDLSGNSGTAVANSSSVAIDAVKNWWGTASSTEIASLVSGSVTTDPWYVNSSRNVLSNEAVTPDDSGNVTITNSAPNVVVSSDTQPITINADSISDATVVLGSLITSGTGSIPQITINSSAVNVEIPASTITSEDADWDGVLNLPTIVSAPSIETDEGTTATAVTAIEVGAGDTELTFNEPVKLTFSGQAGNSVGWSRAGDFTAITDVCDPETPPSLDDGEDCKIASGADLVVWTKHFTTFVTYTQSSAAEQSSSARIGGQFAPSATIATTEVPTATVQAGEVLGAALLFPSPMGIGYRGQEVLDLQVRLQAEGYFKANPTGYFGSITRAAVKAYQQMHGISATGFVGPLTLASLNSTSETAFATPAVNPQVAAIKTQLISLIQQLISELQAQVAAAVQAQN
jgi:hypothetical protein